MLLLAVHLVSFDVGLSSAVLFDPKVRNLQRKVCKQLLSVTGISIKF